MSCAATRSWPASCRRARWPTPARLAGELAALCRERLAYYKAPGYVAFCAALPLTPTEKVQRGELKALGAQLLGRRECIDLRALKRREAP